MASSTGQNPAPSPKSTRWFVLAIVVAALMLSLWSLFGSRAGIRQALSLKAVTRGDLPISVHVSGNLESQDEIKVTCEVDDIEGDQIHGTPILWIVPNGSSVKKGELLVELDGSSLKERLDRQVLDTEAARSQQIQAQVKYENQKTQNETSLAEAQLQVRLAELALKQFEDEDGGTFQINLQDVELLVQEAQASKLIEVTNLEGVTQLYKLGYRSSGELAQARLSAMRAERQLASAISKKKELVEYQYHKTKLELQGQLASAKRSLTQVERDNAALLAQAEAATRAADESLKKEEERLARYRDQLDKCKIHAPSGGMVAYERERSRYHEEVQIGAAMRPRQTILTLPNLERMQVRTSVHESERDRIRPGLPATIRIEALRDRMYRGEVRSVAVLPTHDYRNPDTKFYETLIVVNEKVSGLKPGMTASVEIHVDHLRDVIAVPEQAIVDRGHGTYCLVQSGANVEYRDIEVGLTNGILVEVREGLEEDEFVVLNPRQVEPLLDSSERGDDEDDEDENAADPAENKASPKSGGPLTETSAPRGSTVSS